MKIRVFRKCSFLHTFDDISLNQGFEFRKVNNVLKLNLSNMLLFSIYEGNTKKPVFQAILLPLGHFSVGQCHILTVLWGILRLNDWVNEDVLQQRKFYTL